MKLFKKIYLSSFLVLLLLFFSPMAVAAKAEANVSAETIAANQENIIVPINISSDTKIMGFKITVAYNEQVKVKGVSRGSVTSTGNFSTNFGIYDGKFDIIWNNTSSVEANGTLFALTLDTTNVTDNAEIRLTFSQPDTFDGEYHDVRFVMENIKITSDKKNTAESSSYEENSELSDKSDASENTPTSSQISFDSSQLADSVNNSLSSEDKENIYDISPEEEDKFVENVNNNLQTILGTNDNFYHDFKDIINAYESHYTDSFTSDVLINLDSSEIQDIIDAALKEVAADTPSGVKENNKKKFICLVEEKVREKIPDMESISDKINTELAFDTISHLYDVSSQTNRVFNDSFTTDEDISENKTTIRYIVYIVVFIVAVSAIFSTIVVVKRKKHKK